MINVGLGSDLFGVNDLPPLYYFFRLFLTTSHQTVLSLYTAGYLEGSISFCGVHVKIPPGKLCAITDFSISFLDVGVGKISQKFVKRLVLFLVKQSIL